MASKKTPRFAASDVVPAEHPAVPPTPVVGVGASAGGIEAFTALLKALPPDTGLAFVFIQHLAPTHESLLAEILQRTTQMRVLEVRDEPEIEPNCAMRSRRCATPSRS